VTNLITAYRSATVGSLAGQLHPAVIARYGEAACRTSLGGIAADPAYALVVKSISQPGAWDWTTDGRTSKITDTLTISVDVTRSGAPSSTEIHLVVLDGVVRWFSDCGTPLS